MRANDFICDVCGRSCAEATVPLVAYMVVGTPPNYQGPPVDLNAPGVAVPSIVREIMEQPIARREWCIPCLAKAFKLKLVEHEASTPSAL